LYGFEDFVDPGTKNLKLEISQQQEMRLYKIYEYLIQNLQQILQTSKNQKNIQLSPTWNQVLKLSYQCVYISKLITNYDLIYKCV